MPDFTSRHRSKLTDPTRVSKTKLERGMVAKIRYKKRDNSQRDMFVFILQPKFKNYFHCLDLKDCAPDKFTKLAEDLNEVTSTTPGLPEDLA